MGTEPLTLASLQTLIRDALAYPYAWEKVGLGDAKAEAVASFCRDRSAHIAQAVWSLLGVESEYTDGRDCPYCEVRGEGVHVQCEADAEEAR